METKVRLKADGPFKVNEKLAGLVPMATAEEQAALTADIRANQQRDPIILWNKEVIDGRCRQQALVLLGYNILYKELDDNLTEDEVKVFVKSVNTRRNLTMTQKTMSACRQSLSPDAAAVGKIAESWGISKKLLDNARYIAKQRPEFVEPLFNGTTVTIVNPKGQEVVSTKITAIYAYLKRMEEQATENNDHAWEANSYIKTQAGKEWYYEQLKDISDIGSTRTQMLIAELANYKFVKISTDK